jgi:DNA-binding XRE family transcriptional regulator
MPKNLKLKAARAEKDLTQSALAEAAGLPPDHQRHRKGRV